MIDKELYKRYLKTNTFGRLIHYDKLDSTNSEASVMAKKNITDGTVIITDNQTAGRGRQSNKWFALPGKSLTFSVIHYPNCNINDVNKYSIITGLAVVDALNELNVKCQLKWPNDILINKRKFGGILCESKVEGKKIRSLVIGIGINVNIGKSDFPNDLENNATSLKIEYGQQYSLEQLLAKFINNLERRIKHLDGFNEQTTDWIKSCAHFNTQVAFKSEDKIIKGIFRGLTSRGQAILQINNEDMVFDSGVIIS